MRINKFINRETVDVSKLAYPILLNYLLTTLFEILDEAIVGHYSVEGFALVGIAASIIFSVTGALGILSVALNILAADKKGKKDEKSFEELFVTSKCLAILIGCIFIGLGVLGGRLFFRKIYGLEGVELEDILKYFYPTTITVLQNMLVFQYSSYFRNKLNSKISLYVTGVSTAVNLFFDYSLVYGKFGLPELGISGAAWGSAIGLFCGLLIYQVVYFKNSGLKYILKKEYIKAIFKLYPSLFGQELMESTVFVLVLTAVVTRLGTTEMAIYKLLDIVCASLTLPAYAYASASQTYALQNHAAKKMDAVKKYLKTGIVSGAMLVIVLCGITYIWKDTILKWIISDTNVISKTGIYLCFIFVLVLIKVPYQVHMSYLQGIGRDKYVFKCTVISTVLSSIMLIVLGHFCGLMGIYMVMIIEYAVLTLLYRK